MAKKKEDPEFKLELTRGNLKTAMSEAGAKNPHALWMVPYDKIKPIPGFNVRVRTPEYEAHIDSIKQSIIENGYYQDRPLTGYVSLEDGEQVIHITDGYTRHEAVGRAIKEGFPIESLPIVIKPNGTSAEDLTIGLVTWNNGRPLTPYETAVVVKRLIGYGMDEKIIAQRLGITRRYVDDLLSLVAAPKPIRDFVTSGQVSATLAIEELAKHGEKAVERLTAAVDKAKVGGDTKATKKHLEKPKASSAVAEARSQPKGKHAKVQLEISTDDVLHDAKVCGFAVGTEVDQKLILLAATLLGRFDVEVFATVADETDPAAGL